MNVNSLAQTLNSLLACVFTVYGPYGRPDMALFSFTKNIINGEKIKLYNNGDMKRDFTYIDDIISGISLVIDKTQK